MMILELIRLLRAHISGSQKNENEK